LISIQGSPSCDPTRGIFIEELKSMFLEKYKELKTLLFLPNTSEPVFKADLHHFYILFIIYVNSFVNFPMSRQKAEICSKKKEKQE
jgi:hypothetical protein